MAKGKKNSPELVYAVIASYSVTGNYNETAKALNLHYNTVRSIVRTNQNKPEFVKLANEKKNQFADRASVIIDKGLTLLNRRLDTAIEHEDALGSIIAEIYASDPTEISQDEKKRLVDKLRVLQVQRMSEITTAVGTLYDKRALSQGESTQNVTFSLPKEVEYYAE